MVKRDTVGSGITKRERVLIESADDMHEWVEQTKGAWDCVGIIERQAVQILKDAGLPTQPAAYFDRPSPAMQSPEWYALEALIWAGRLRKSAEDGKGLEAGRCGVYMGQLWAEAAMKFRWEKYAEAGLAQENNLRNGRESGLSDQDIRAVVDDPIYKTRQKQADKLGISVGHLYRRLRTMT